MLIPPTSYSGHEIPGNAALSPDGNYLLLVVTDMSEELSMYIYDINGEKLGRVNLPDALINERAFHAIFQRGYNNLALDLKWLGENRILATFRDQYRVYDLVVSPVNQR
jgi:hypothetical protein